MARLVTMLLGLTTNLGLKTRNRFLSLTGDVFGTYGKGIFPSCVYAMLVRIPVPNASF